MVSGQGIDLATHNIMKSDGKVDVLAAQLQVVAPSRLEKNK